MCTSENDMSGLRWPGNWRRQIDTATAEILLTTVSLAGPAGTAVCPADAT